MLCVAVLDSSVDSVSKLTNDIVLIVLRYKRIMLQELRSRVSDRLVSLREAVLSNGLTSYLGSRPLQKATAETRVEILSNFQLSVCL